jgi:hypothetical protein
MTLTSHRMAELRRSPRVKISESLPPATREIRPRMLRSALREGSVSLRWLEARRFRRQLVSRSASGSGSVSRVLGRQDGISFARRKGEEQ